MRNRFHAALRRARRLAQKGTVAPSIDQFIQRAGENLLDQTFHGFTGFSASFVA